MSELLFDFIKDEFYVTSSAHALGRVSSTLEELASNGLLASSVESLQEAGYRCNRSAEPATDVLSLAAEVFSELQQNSGVPHALLIHHSYAANTSEAVACDSQELLARARYFPASLLRHFQLDHIPYWGSYTSGCTGFMSLLTLAAGVLRAASVDNALCLTADLKPSHSTYDSARERLLTSDVASGFIASRVPEGYQVLGVAQYSSSRTVIPLVEVVKRAVQMTQQLAALVNVKLDPTSMLCHYPNMFVEAWQMVSHFLRVPKENQILDEMAERAHCLSSDAIIPLKRFRGTAPGRVHAVYSFGSGLHLAVALLREV